MRSLLTVLIAALVVSGCALSPQRIEVDPQVQVKASNVGHNRSIQVLGVDSRGKNEFGSRGGVYDKTALLIPSNDIKAVIADTVRNGLQSLGFNAFNPGGDATTLEVRLEQLDYIPEPGSVVNRVDLNLVLQAEARRGPTTHTGTYKSSVEHKTPFTPSLAQNRQMINDILAKAIERLLQDPEMLAFLAGADFPSDSE